MELPKYFSIAKEQSLLSDHYQHKLGACIIRGKTVLAKGRNRLCKTHPLVKKYHPHKTIHAEVDALLKVKDKNLLKDSTLFVYRQDKEGHPALAKPCITCRQIMCVLGIHKVKYTVKDGWAEEKL